MHSFGEKFSVGSDDFFLPGWLGMWNRIFFLGLNIFFLVMNVGNGIVLEECEAGSSATWQEKMFSGLLGGFLLISGGSLLTYIAMFWVSTRGTPADVEYRDAKMPKVIIAIVLFYALECVFGGLFTYLCFEFERDHYWADAGFSEGCQTLAEQKFTLLIFSTVMIWLDMCAFVFGVWVFLHRYDAKSNSKLHLNEFDHGTVQWEACMRVWCKLFRVISCNLFGFVGGGAESDEAYRSVAETFNTWFHNTGLTLTDLLVAFILIRRDQKLEREAEERYKPRNRGESSLYIGAKGQKKNFNVLGSSMRAFTLEPEDSGSDADDIESGLDTPRTPTSAQERDFKEMQRVFDLHYEYLPYMIGMYGWKLMIYQNTVRMKPFSALRKVLKFPTAERNIGNNDGCFKCNHTALLAETGVAPGDVVYASFGSVAKDSKQSLQVPHAVFLDHKKKSVVIAMRGTLSLSDLLIDAMIEPESLVEAGRMWGFDGKGHYAHAGMLKVALRIRRILERNEILHKLFGVKKREYEYFDNGDTEGLEKPNMPVDELPDCRDYKLIVLGHSLGAAAAAILTLCLRPTFTNAHCIAYAGPGAVFSYELAEQSKEWCSCVWVGNDIVARLCWQTLEKLRIKVYDVLWRCKVSKAAVLRSALTPWGGDIHDLLYEPFEVPDTPGRKFLQEKQTQFENKKKSKKMEQIPMYQAGVLVHMAKLETITEHGMCFKTKHRIYEPYLVKDRTVLDEPQISTRSLFDHFPDLLPEIMGEVRHRHGMVDVKSGETALKRVLPYTPATGKVGGRKSTIEVAGPKLSL